VTGIRVFHAGATADRPCLLFVRRAPIVGRVTLRPVVEDDLAMFRRFATEPGLIGLDWAGFRDAQGPACRFAADGYLGADDGRLMVEVEPEHVAAGFVTWRAGSYAPRAQYWEIGIALLPEWRGRGVGWRAQAMLCGRVSIAGSCHRRGSGDGHGRRLLRGSRLPVRNAV
jgi:hypothetical protein